MKSVLGILTLLIVAGANAQSLKLGSIGYGGTGCPANSLSSKLEDNGTLIVWYDKMEVQANATSAFGRINCSVRAPLEIPAGFKVIVKEASTEGIYNVENEGDSITVDQNISFVGGTKALKPMHQVLTDAWNYLEILPSEDPQDRAESKCGGSSMLAMSVTAVLKNPKSVKSETLISVYRSDLKLKLVPCE